MVGMSETAFVVGSRVRITKGPWCGHTGWIFAPFGSPAPTGLRWEVRLDNGHHSAVAGTDISHAPDQDPLEPVYDWLVTELSYPFDLRTEPPPWLDARRLAQAWHKHDPSATPEEWLWAICAEADWPLAAP